MLQLVEKSLSHIVVGVADLQPVHELWVDCLGLEVVAESRSPDPALAEIWGLDENSVAEQLLLRTPGATTGWLHFVRFSNPAAPVRLDSAPHDLCPKNIDVNCTDLPVRKSVLEQYGLQFRSEPSEYQVGNITAREVQASVHDDINMVLIEVLGESPVLSEKQFGAVTSFVLTVPDIIREQRFFADVLGLDTVLEHHASGEAIEKVIGLPPGAALKLILMGQESNIYGRVELIEYEGLQGNNLYPSAKPPALGSLLGRFETDSLDTLLARLRNEGISVSGVIEARLIFGHVRLASFHTPAGFRLEVFERKT